MPQLPPLVETMLGTVTSGWVRALLFDGVFGNANSIVNDAPKNTTHAIRLLTLLFMGGCDCIHFPSPELAGVKFQKKFARSLLRRPKGVNTIF